MSTIKDLNRFVKNPVSISIKRSKFNRGFTHKTTFKSGKLVPIFLDEVIAGDTFKVNLSSVVRMLTPVVPVMDNAFLDVYFFYVPCRLATIHPDDWQKINGENKGGYWAPSSESTLESTGNVLNGDDTGAGFVIPYDSVPAYMGLPVGDWSGNNDATAWREQFNFNIMPFVAYTKIWNEFFRDQNTQAPVSINNASDVQTLYFKQDSCLDVNKLHDYFCSALPAPQKGDAVLLPMSGSAPVITGEPVNRGHQRSATWLSASGTTVQGAVTLKGNAVEGAVMEVNNTTPSMGTGIYPSNLYADLQNATAVSVNEMRQAIAIQRMLEKDARGGTRYREMLKAHFGVTVPDLTVQVPEYLAGKRVPLNITQVLQTSETSSTPLGTTGAFSNTSFSDYMFTKSFNEAGYIIGVACVRTEQSYSQGVAKLWTRNRRYDWYDPTFANLGEQAIFKRELFLQHSAPGVTAPDFNEVFGYQEAWADYRFHPNQISGALAPNAGNANFTAWTYTNNFSAAPTLNSAFMKQPSSQIGDTLVVTNTKEQFVADFYFDAVCVRPMPLYSIPGLMDHH